MVRASEVTLICFIIGTVFVFGGFVYYMYTERIFVLIGYIYVHPYRDYAMPLWVIGILFILFGLLYPSLSKELAKQIEIIRHDIAPPSARFCRYCGRRISTEAKFCPYCGQALE